MPTKRDHLEGRYVLFDGELAQAWLDHDEKVRAGKTKNRKVSKPNVQIKVQDMLNDSFVPTGQNPTIDQNTAIIDGQHTFHAIVQYYEEAEKPTPVLLWIKEGEDPKNFPFYDQGKPRSTADVFGIANQDYPQEIAHAARLLWIRVHGKRIAGAGKVGPYTLAEFVKKGHTKLKASMKFIMSFGKEEDSIPCSSLLSPGYAAALHYLMTSAAEQPEAADEFWKLLIENEAPKGSAIKKLYVKLSKSKNPKTEMKLTRDQLVDYIVEAFNSWMENSDKLTINKNDRPLLKGLDSEWVNEVEEE